METRTDEFLREFDQMIDEGYTDLDMTYLKDRNRPMILLLLDKVEASKDKRYIPILEAWKAIDYKKIQKRIGHVVRFINQN